MGIVLRKWCGAVCALIMGSCVILTIKIGDNQNIGEWVCGEMGLSRFTPSKWMLLATLFFFWWTWGKVMHNIHAVWINWARICFSLLMFGAMVSFVCFR